MAVYHVARQYGFGERPAYTCLTESGEWNTARAEAWHAPTYELAEEEARSLSRLTNAELVIIDETGRQIGQTIRSE